MSKPRSTDLSLQVISVLIWLSFGLYHIFSVLESMGTQFISVGEYVTSYSAIIGGLGLLAAMIYWFSPVKTKKSSNKLSVWNFGSIYRNAVWPVLFWSFAAIILTICFGAVLTHKIGFYTQPSYLLPIDVLGPTDSVTSFHLFSATCNGMVFFFGIPALHTFFLCYSLKMKKNTQNEYNTIVTVATQ
jgi:hypothetical protein